MEKGKKGKLTAMALTAAMAASVMPVPAYAETVVTPNGDGTTTTTSTNVTTDGETGLKLTVSESTTTDDASGAVLSQTNSNTQESSSTDENGNTTTTVSSNSTTKDGEGNVTGTTQSSSTTVTDSQQNIVTSESNSTDTTHETESTEGTKTTVNGDGEVVKTETVPAEKTTNTTTTNSSDVDNVANTSTETTETTTKTETRAEDGTLLADGTATQGSETVIGEKEVTEDSHVTLDLLEPKLDENGKPVLDEAGKQVYEKVTVTVKPMLDAEGKPVYDAEGNLIYEKVTGEAEDGTEETWIQIKEEENEEGGKNSVFETVRTVSGQIIDVIVEKFESLTDLDTIKHNDSVLGAEGSFHTEKELYHRPDSDAKVPALGNGAAPPDGYDFRFVSYGQESMIRANATEEEAKVDDAWGDSYQAKQFVLVEYERNEDGTIKTDANGAPVIKDSHTVYCTDFDVSAEGGHWYKVDNLDRADYYQHNADPNDPAADHIRFIVKNGYWGTTVEKNEDGSIKYDENGKEIPETGSLEKVKELLNQAKTDGKIGDVDFSGLTEGEALMATQAAIWVFGNSKLEDGITLNEENPIGLQYNGIGNWSTVDDPSAARIMAMYHYLIGQRDSTPETPVINEENNFSDISLIVQDKVEGDPLNQDVDDNNDKYNADLSFKLVIVPTENDDISVFVVGSDGETKASAKLGTANSADDSGKLKPNEDGSYTLTGLKLQENSDISFDLKLEGTQYLDQGVYVYTAQTTTDSQTFVGLAEGSRDFSVTKKVEMEFDVKEAKVKTVRTWSSSSSNEYTVTEEPENHTDPEEEKKEEEKKEEKKEETKKTDPSDILGDEEQLLDEVEEEPEEMLLDDNDEIVAATGDSNHMTSAAGGMLAALAGMLLLRKRKKI